jgi:hypothetical protein
VCCVAVALVAALTGCGTTVPDVKGKTVAQAERALTDAGFKSGKVTWDEKAEGAAGAVVSQDPAGGAKVSAGSIVNLVVAGAQSDPPPGTGDGDGTAGALVTVPDLVTAVLEWYPDSGTDITEPDFEAKLDAFLRTRVSGSGLTVRVTWATSPKEKPSQQPAAGTKVPQGTQVTVHLVGGE